MTRIIRLAPHDPIPDAGPHGLVLRRLGEDNPTAIVGQPTGSTVFFEKKNQKTFASGRARCGNARAQGHESFLLLFFKKQVFLPL